MSIGSLPENNDIPFKINRGSTDTTFSLENRDILITNPATTGTFIQAIEHDFFWTATEENPYYVSFQNQLNPLDLQPTFWLIELIIGNRCGETSTYSIQLYNYTTDEILEEQEDVEVPNKTTAVWHILLPAEKFNMNDGLAFITYKGKIGTHGEEPVLGKYGMRFTSMVLPEETKRWEEIENL